MAAIVLTLASAGTATAGLEIITSWLSRDRGRETTVSYYEDGRLQSVSVEGGDERAIAHLVATVQALTGA